MMQNNTQHKLYFRLSGVAVMLLLVALNFACKKATDETNPVISILQPTENQAYTLGDSILIQGSASDETQLTDVIVALTDKQFILRDYQVNIPVTSNPQHFSFWYVPTNLQLPDGDYYIQVRASDGINTKYKYQPIRLTQGSRPLRQLLVITRNGNASYTLHTLDTTTLALDARVTYPHTFAGSDISLQSRQLYLVGRGFGECYALDTEDYLPDFNLPQDGTPSSPYHEGVIAFGDRFYLGLTEGYIKGYNKLGMQQFLSSINSERKPVLMATHQYNFLVVAEAAKAGYGAWVASYYLHSGAKWTEYKLPDAFEPTAIVSLSDDEVMIAGNVQGKGRIVVWNITANAISTPWQFNYGTIRSILKLNQMSYLLAIDAGVMLYFAPTQTSSMYISHPGTTTMRYDPTGQTLFLGTQNTLSAFDINTKMMLWQKALPGTLAGFHLQY